MSHDESTNAANQLHQKLAADMLARRRLRNKHFDRQAFGEQRWDMMLALFASTSGRMSIDAASQALAMPPATTLALARILAGHNLIELGDSDGGWNEIPIRLSASGGEKMQAYFTEVVEAKLGQ